MSALTPMGLLAEVAVAFKPMVKTEDDPSRKWVGLTDEEITLAMMRVEEQGSGYFLRLARAIEAKIKEKNT